ncbi:MAG TPA: HAD-IIIA family hydrolase [Candidatus Janibacter merdipullorum]|nr:HAD-IIIA family hydrolase [Candidatus Janibacter merdipullorum]
MVRGRGPRGAGADLTSRPWWFGPEALEPGAPDAPFDLVFLDRDGTLNERVVDGYVTRPEDLVLLPGAAEAVATLTRAGCRTVLVTNQRGIARGLMERADLEAVHARLVDELTAAGARLDAIAVCPHGVGECSCRKPQDGLFREALSRAPWARVDRCLLVGDMPSDIEPARGLGMRTLRVDEVTRIGAGIEALLGRRAGRDWPLDERRGEGHVP